MRKKREPRAPRMIRFRESDEWAVIKTVARMEGIPPSTYAREAAVREARRELAQEPEERAHP